MAWTVGAGAHTLRSWARDVFNAPSFGLVLVALLTVSGLMPADALAAIADPPGIQTSAGGGAGPSLEQIVANVRTATGGLPGRVSFRQDIELRVLLFRWSFHADVTQKGRDIEVHMHGAPRFLEPDVTTSLLEVSEGLDGFDLELVERGTTSEGDPFYVVRGTAPAGRQSGATGGTIRIDGRTWLVEEAELHYSWGNMTVRQSFQTINGYTLLKEQQATVDRLGAKLLVQYGGYSFEKD